MPVFISPLSAHRPRRAIAILAVALAAHSAVGCSRPARSDSADVDDFDQPIPVGLNPARVVSLNPSTTEIIFALGAGRRLVGRSRWDSWPDSARSIPQVGDAIRPNVEALLALRPQLVLLYASNDNRPAADRLRDAGIYTMSVKLDSIAQFRRTVRHLGLIFGDTVRASAVIDSVDRTLERVRLATADRRRPSVFFHVWERPLQTIGGGSFLSELVWIAGGRNVYGDLPGPSPSVTLEDVVQRDPDVIVVSPITAAALRESPRWIALRAVREGRVFTYDTNVVGRPSVTMGMAAVNLASLLHPGLVR